MKFTCSKCFGNKTYRGMGSMMIKCEPCNGQGSIEIESKLSIPEPAVEEKVSKKPRKGNFDEERSRNNKSE